VIEQRPKTTTLLSTLSTPVNDERRQPPRCLRTGASRDSASFPPSIFPTFDSAPPRHCHRRTPPLPHDSSANSLPHLLPQRPPPPFVEGAALRASRVLSYPHQSTHHGRRLYLHILFRHYSTEQCNQGMFFNNIKISSSSFMSLGLSAFSHENVGRRYPAFLIHQKVRLTCE